MSRRPVLQRYKNQKGKLTSVATDDSNELFFSSSARMVSIGTISVSSTVAEVTLVSPRSKKGSLKQIIVEERLAYFLPFCTNSTSWTSYSRSSLKNLKLNIGKILWKFLIEQKTASEKNEALKGKNIMNDFKKNKYQRLT